MKGWAHTKEKGKLLRRWIVSCNSIPPLSLSSANFSDSITLPPFSSYQYYSCNWLLLLPSIHTGLILLFILNKAAKYIVFSVSLHMLRLNLEKRLV